MVEKESRQFLGGQTRAPEAYDGTLRMPDVKSNNEIAQLFFNPRFLNFNPILHRLS